MREKGGSRKILPLLEGGSWEKNLVMGGVMQLSNDTSKNSTSPPYLVKNERSLIKAQTRRDWLSQSACLVKPNIDASDSAQSIA